MLQLRREDYERSSDWPVPSSSFKINNMCLHTCLLQQLRINRTNLCEFEFAITAKHSAYLVLIGDEGHKALCPFDYGHKALVAYAPREQREPVFEQLILDRAFTTGVLNSGHA